MVPACAALLAGCASPSVTAFSGSGVQVSASELFSPGPSISLLSDFSRRAYQRRERTATDERGHWMIQIYPAASKLADAQASERPERTLELSRAADGSVLLHTITDASKRTVTVSYPPVVLMPNMLSGEQPHRAESRVTVLDAGNQSKRLDEGTAIATVNVIQSDERSCRLQTNLEFDLSSAKVNQMHTYTLERVSPRGQWRVVADDERLRVHVGIIRLINVSANWRVMPPDETTRH